MNIGGRAPVQQNLLLPLLNLSLLAEQGRIFPRYNSWEDLVRNHRRFGELVACYLSNHKAPRRCGLSCGFREPICRSGFICPIIALMLPLMCHVFGFSEALKKKKKVFLPMAEHSGEEPRTGTGSY